MGEYKNIYTERQEAEAAAEMAKYESPKPKTNGSGVENGRNSEMKSEVTELKMEEILTGPVTAASVEQAWLNYQAGREVRVANALYFATSGAEKAHTKKLTDMGRWQQSVPGSDELFPCILEGDDERRARKVLAGEFLYEDLPPSENESKDSGDVYRGWR